MQKTISLPFGINLEVTPQGATLTASRLEREFYVPTDDLGSKAESARIAFELLSAASLELVLSSTPQLGRSPSRAPHSTSR